jgi:hypothetical protein
LVDRQDFIGGILYLAEGGFDLGKIELLRYLGIYDLCELSKLLGSSPN